MPTNTAALKTFAQQTRIKLISLIETKMDYILTQDTAELRGFESEINRLKQEIATKGKDLVVKSFSISICQEERKPCIASRSHIMGME